MKHICWAALSLGVLTSVDAGAAWAQYGPQYQMPSSRPAVSPYLNLLRSGATPGENYYNLVQPQLQFGAGINQLQSQTMANRSAISSLEGGAAGQFTTGHRSGFMTASRYFMNNGSGAPAGPRGSGAAFGPRSGYSEGASPGVGQGAGGLGQNVGSGIGQSAIRR
jgi:hypothetical protein